MNRKEWLACTDPTEMLELLRGDVSHSTVMASWQKGWSPRPDHPPSKVSDRKLRLFACGCCRLVWQHLMRSELCLRGVEVADRYADDETLVEELRATRAAHLKKTVGTCHIATALARPIAWDAAQSVAKFAARVAGWAASQELDPEGTTLSDRMAASKEAERAALKIEDALLRDITGYPLSRSRTAIHPSWRTADVLSLAHGAYHERLLPNGRLDPEGLAVLSDALEEAGCDSKPILDHLRSPGPHFRGHWALDLILNKE